MATMHKSYFNTLRWLLFMAVAAVLFPTCAPADESVKKVVLQFTDSTLEKQVLVLNVADNLVTQYGDKLKLEIVAYGPGLELLLSNGAQEERVRKLAGQGVRFSACGNTQMKLAKLTGIKPSMNPASSSVECGACRIIDLVQQGYILMRP